MPRTARVAPNEQVYHILTRGNNRKDVFKEEKDYEKYGDILRRYKEKYGFRLYHFVFMRNHIHLVLEPAEGGGSLAEIMKGVNLSYAQYYKKRYGHIGHFWQDRYKSIMISKDDYLLACGSYVELNPVRARIVEDPKHYRWSSYNVYAYGRNDTLIDRHPIYEGLSPDDTGRQKRYREFVKGMLKDRNALKGEMDKRVIYGNADLIKEMTAAYEVKPVIREKGRPKKKDEDLK
jgi:putative transposase